MIRWLLVLKEGECVSKKETYEQKAEALLMPIIEQHNFELVDVEYVKEGSNWYLRAYIDKEGGITVDDCEVVSRAFSDKLDEEDFIEEAYIMEVSSPGLGRPLKKEKDYKDSLDEIVEIVGLKERRKHTPRELSGGQQQRVAIARALINEPDIILADEPIGNLDSKTGIEIMELMQRINREKNKTIVQVTHSPESSTYGNRTIFLRDGEICSKLYKD